MTSEEDRSANDVGSSFPGDQELLAAYRAGDQSAAEALFERYYSRLIELIRRDMGWHARGVEDSADVALSALRSFFEELKQSRIVVSSDSDLWPLLITITLNKIRNKGRFWTRQRRDRRRETELSQDPLEGGVSPDDVVALKEVVELLLASFPDRRRRILELTLQGYPVKEVAQLVGSTERTVYNTRRGASVILDRMLSVE
jgi:RNA polymerase sigma factor (sigma-70 family)